MFASLQFWDGHLGDAEPQLCGMAASCHASRFVTHGVFSAELVRWVERLRLATPGQWTRYGRAGFCPRIATAARK